MSYQTILPQVFSVCTVGTPDYIRMQVEKLMSSDREDVPNGSSFAVTMDIPGQHTLWLSETSARFLTGGEL